MPVIVFHGESDSTVAPINAQRIVERDEVDGSLGAGEQTFVERDALARAAAFLRAARAVRRLRDAGRRVVLVSGGLREAILPVARKLGIADEDVHAVAVRFSGDGEYLGFDDGSPLATAVGKRAVVESLALAPRVLAVGDGATDLAIRPVVDAFAAFTGFVRRTAIVNDADLVVESFDQLTDLVLA